ncbi:hypothetical protein AB434_3376 [Heyndrickxia coagulans]|jgi:hypothetical protein|uniref:Uncharacterized protein n=1 Tax=Heyndrickxia coagulans TaxID=1398 RepID=A0A0C5C7T6_HEYCO|nr:hypothetical protein SB48_HM08orf03015 [Heyndrickxia coagulans]AKN55781.1 hypothetical protein AB434_3376 [Heyndrickxia coagulans]KWZ79551.1 hypothetical protein HMPREF3213_02655 [Heyndrickxia coagulans]KYC64046.1 hypothetical protein B4100_3180 [Heyndrickxia coagulans]KYC87154.1 hypothetical protein B4096_3066 [Heyndrickxia coagulans]
MQKNAALAVWTHPVAARSSIHEINLRASVRFVADYRFLA